MQKEMAILHLRKGKTYNNYAWENKSFRAYADYMCSHEFREGIDELLSLEEQGEKEYNNNISVICAEALS